MKCTVYLFMSLLFLAACKKDAIICKTYTELTSHDNLVDISALKNSPEIYDTLVKYQLQVTEIVNDNFLFGFKSRVFYKDLMVFNENYFLYKNQSGAGVFSIGRPTIDSINFSLTPTLSFKAAIGIAVKNMDFSKTCISYRLGILNINAGISNAPKNYKLVWKIEGDSGWPLVMLDANTGQVYRKDDGIRI